MKTVAYRLEVLESFLKATIPILKIDALRDLLEYGRFRLTDSSHLRNLVPEVLRRHVEGTKTALSKVDQVSLIFDGTSHDGEVMAVLIRYWIQEKKKFGQRLIKVRLSDLALNRDELGCVLVNALTRVGVHPIRVIGCIHDAASVNFAAVTAMSTINTRNALNLCCWSHIFNRVGSRLEFPLARSLIKTSANVFRKSVKVFLLFNFNHSL